MSFSFISWLEAAGNRVENLLLVRKIRRNAREACTGVAVPAALRMFRR